MYYPQGAYGVKNWGKHGPLTNPYAFGYIEHMKHQGDDRRFPQAFCIYEAAAMPGLQGKIIAANSLHNIVWVSQLIPDGSTFRTVDEEPLVRTTDRWFRPVWIGTGPDGFVYLADWYDSRLSHVRPVDDWHRDERPHLPDPAHRRGQAVSLESAGRDSGAGPRQEGIPGETLSDKRGASGHRGTVASR